MKFMPLLFAGVRKLASKPADRPANLTRLRARSRFNASSMTTDSWELDSDKHSRRELR